MILLFKNIPEKFYFLISLFISTVSSAQWKQIELPSHSPTFDILEAGEFYFTYQERVGIYRSNDIGVTWETKMNGLPPTSKIRDLAIVANTLFVATFGEGVFRSSDSGENWEAVGSDLPSGTYYNFATDGQYNLYN